MKPIVIIEYGAGNVYSVAKAVERLGYPAICSADPAVLCDAEKVIFPGVGQASAAMSQLKASGLDLCIPRLRVPVLGICLGMQLMCEYTEEGGTPGLGIFPGRACLFPDDVKVPHIGWNEINHLDSKLMSGIPEGSRVYFVHSYYVPVQDFTVAVCEYGCPFSAALGYENFWGCQFHPEKSGGIGEQVLRNFLEM